MNDARPPDPASDALARLQELSAFDGEPARFWPRYLAALVELCDAERACVAVRGDGRWTEVAGLPSPSGLVDEPGPEQFDAWASRLQERRVAALIPSDGKPAGHRFAVGAVGPGPGDPPALAVLRLNGGGGDGETLARLTLALGVPQRFEQHRQLQAARRDASRLAGALDLVVLLGAHARFPAAAMALCNELAARFGCERVSLGWIEANYIVVKAMSHTEKIEPKTSAVEQLAASMEEACDQEEEIVWPRPEGHAFVTRDHETHARAQHVANLATLPLFLPDDAAAAEGALPAPVAAVTLERNTSAFTAEDLRTLRLMLDQVTRPLAELHDRDRWFGARWAAMLRKAAGRILGAEHTGWKLLATALAVAILVLIFGTREHRVEGTFTLKTDAMVHLTAPFEGHIERVMVKPGDLVRSGGAMVALDTRELLLQQEAAAAEHERHAADALKAESAGDAAGMRIAQARGAQTRAQMDILRDRLARAELRAPFDGVVVEGDLREKIAAPVRKGDVLVKLARIENLYPVVEVPERDIQEVREGARGQAAFASLPSRRFPFTIARIEPMARAGQKGSHFAVRGDFTEPAADWWRPGMSGIAKIDAGRRSLLWIATHRTVDFLRMWWW